jgi:predicted RNA-binding Zn-ribbon protein involved in translation (DUF1610 family)
MNSRSWSIGILLLAIAAGALAYALRFDACLTAAVVAVVGVVTLSAVVISRARRKLAQNRARLMRSAQMCPACGYSIRVVTDRCPECGAAVEGDGLGER